jgi:hypothetical protein
LVDRYGICVTNDHGYVQLIVNTSRSFRHSRLITGSIYPSGAPEFTPGFSVVCAAQSLKNLLVSNDGEGKLFIFFSIKFLILQNLHYSRRHGMINHCDIHITFLSDTDIYFES